MIIRKSISVQIVLLMILPVVSPLYASNDSTLLVFPRRDASTTIKLFTPLAKYLSEKTGTNIKLRTVANYKTFMSALKTGDIGLVHLNQFQYINAHRDYGYEVIAQNEEFGEKNIAGAIYVRRDSGISQLHQLKGKNIVFGGGHTAMMSYIVPTHLLRAAGLKAGDYQEKISVSPPNAVITMYLGHADAAGAGELVSQLPLVNKKINSEKLKIIARSPKLPHLVWAVSKNTSEKDKQVIKSALINLKNTKKGTAILNSARLTGFNSAVDADYDIHRNIIDSVLSVKH